MLRLSERVSVKDRVFRTSSGQSDELAADAVAGRALARPLTLSATLSGRRGERPRLLVEAAGEEVTVEGESPLEAARTAGLTADKARRAIGALGGTPYVLGEFEFAVDEGAFLGVGDLKDLRRAARRRARRAAAGGAAAGAARRRPASRRRQPPAPGRRARASRGRRPAAPPAARPEGRLCACGPARSSWAPRTSTPSVSTCAPATTSQLVAAAREAVQAAGLPVRVRSPEVLFDADERLERARSRPSSGTSSTPVTSRR